MRCSVLTLPSLRPAPAPCASSFSLRRCYRRVKGRLQPTRGFGDGVYKDAAFNQLHRNPIASKYTPPYTTADADVIHTEVGICLGRVCDISPVRDWCVLPDV